MNKIKIPRWVQILEEIENKNKPAGGNPAGDCNESTTSS